MNNDYLKVKICSLAAEARIIKRLELARRSNARRLRAKGSNRSQEQYDAFWGLRSHRIHVVRPEARAAHLARAYLQGRDPRTVEHKAYERPDFDRVARIAGRFGGFPAGSLEGRVIREWYDQPGAPNPAQAQVEKLLADKVAQAAV